MDKSTFIDAGSVVNKAVSIKILSSNQSANDAKTN